MCMELQPHFTKEDFSEARREWDWALSQHSVHGFPNRHSLCNAPFACDFPTSEPMGLACREWIRIHNSHRYRKRKCVNSWVWLHTCLMLVFVFTSVPVYLCLPICSSMQAEEQTKEDRKAQKAKQKRREVYNESRHNNYEVRWRMMERKRLKEKVKYVIIPNGQSLSFNHKKQEQWPSVEWETMHVTASYTRPRLCETRDRIVLLH